MHISIEEMQGEHDVVGVATGSELTHVIHFERLGAIKATTQLLARGKNPFRRAAYVVVLREDRVGRIADLDARRTAQPHDSATHELRVQGAHESRDPHERKARRHESRTSHPDDIGGGTRAGSAIEQPVHHIGQGRRFAAHAEG